MNSPRRLAFAAAQLCSGISSSSFSGDVSGAGLLGESCLSAPDTANTCSAACAVPVDRVSTQRATALPLPAKARVATGVIMSLLGRGSHFRLAVCWI